MYFILHTEVISQLFNAHIHSIFLSLLLQKLQSKVWEKHVGVKTRVHIQNFRIVVAPHECPQSEPTKR